MAAQMATYSHVPGLPFKCIPVVLTKSVNRNAEGEVTYKCGFRIGGGIDQDANQSPYGYPDSGIYITYVEPGGPADQCGLKMHDKILQVNGYDFTLLTHERAVHYLKKNERLKMLIARPEVQEFP
uniref:PDZ domain-containing protein n=1 Tax=Trichuris muris TaxID=70415 RepID=A0A5S6QFA8_TRIMR